MHIMNLSLSAIHCKISTGKTKTIKKSLNPKWEESFTLKQLLHTNKALFLKIYDEDSFKEPDYIGFINYPQ